jgi:2-polyprenyl-6-methoxyphenol hydroxylase-like FAD-dependent oxidoreductase
MGPRLVNRQDLTKVLYDGLKDETRQNMHPSKSLTNITTSQNAIVATCEDGTSYEGSIIIGADGAHSITRHLLSKLSSNSPRDERDNSEDSFLTTYVKPMGVRVLL